MNNVDPSIMNRFRRKSLGGDPNRNVVPVQRSGEEIEPDSEHEEALRRPLGRLAATAERIRNATLRAAGETGETTT